MVFKEGLATPFRTVGRASIAAWFFQYSVMGFIFQTCDRALSSAMGVPRVVYGEELMQPPKAEAAAVALSVSEQARVAAKAVLAPALAGTIESVVANRAEAQRFHGLPKLAAIETKLGWGPIARACGPGFVANASRNFVMSATSFVLTPTLYQRYFPQERKSQASLFWFGLGATLSSQQQAILAILATPACTSALGTNIFFGNVIAITQQALWGRALDYGAVNGGTSIHFSPHAAPLVHPGPL